MMACTEDKMEKEVPAGEESVNKEREGRGGDGGESLCGRNVRFGSTLRVLGLEGHLPSVSLVSTLLRSLTPDS